MTISTRFHTAVNVSSFEVVSKGNLVQKEILLFVPPRSLASEELRLGVASRFPHPFDVL